MKISQIYTKYKLPPELIDHQLRVGMVGYSIASNWKTSTDVDLSLLSCLLHDMGNIVKFNFDKPLTDLGDVEYWRGVQREFWDKYGRDAHVATKEIVSEIGRVDVNEILEEEGKIFGKNWDVVSGASVPAQILLYADHRVMPHGIVSLDERIEDLSNRYGNKYKPADYHKLEEELQSNTSLELKKINESDLEKFRDQFLSVTI